jgi:streptogramin lyase
MGRRVFPSHRGVVVVLSLILASILFLGPEAGAATRFREVAIPTANSSPVGITAGPDGNLWFTENAGNKIGRITTTGVITEFPVPSSDSSPYGITAGQDGNLWFTDIAGT